MQQPIGDFRPRSRGDLRGGEIESEELPTANFLVAIPGNYGGFYPRGMVRIPRGPLIWIYMARHMRREDWTCGHANRQMAGGERGMQPTEPKEPVHKPVLGEIEPWPPSTGGRKRVLGKR